MRKIKDIAKSILAFSKQHPLIVITLVSLICLYDVYGMYGQRGCDKETYLEAASLLMHGELDCIRTPSYPAIVALCQWISSQNGLVLLILLQIAIFWLSARSLYSTLRYMGIARNIAIIMFGVMTLSPIFLFPQVTIMTESFAVSFSVFMISYFVKWMQNGRWGDFIKMSLCILYLIFLRPSFLYMLIAMAIIAALLIKRKEYRKGLQLSAIIVIFGGLMFGYCKIIESKIGVFTPSTVSINNTVANSINIGKFASKNITDTLIKQGALDFERNGGSHEPFAAPYLDGMSPKRVYEELQCMKKKDKLMYVKFFVVNFRETIYNHYTEYYHFNVDFGFVYLFVFGIGCLFVYNVAIRRRNSLILIFMWLLCVGNILVNLLGANAHWTRLFLPSVPLLLIFVAKCCNRFKIRYVKA
jgi:hypothetical protein